MSVTEMVLPNKQTQKVMLLTCIRGSLFRIQTPKPTVLIVLCPCNKIPYISRRNNSVGGSCGFISGLRLQRLRKNAGNFSE